MTNSHLLNYHLLAMIVIKAFHLKKVIFTYILKTNPFLKVHKSNTT